MLFIGRASRPRLGRRGIMAVLAALVAALSTGLVAQDGRASISAADLKQWLTYIASDALQGRAIYSAGLGLAAAYVSDHLQSWGVTPAGDSGSYLQTVRIV